MKTEVVDIAAKKTEYVLGFVFSADRKRLLLIRKNRPAFLEGMLNGVGGHIEPGELPVVAMRRECYEEAGLLIPLWHHVATLEFIHAVVTVFTATGEPDNALPFTDEPLMVVNLDEGLPNDVVPNLRWLVPFCLDLEIKQPPTLRMWVSFARDEEGRAEHAA